jgi:4-hydroxy-2-oxoheptanedioate aldolase
MLLRENKTKKLISEGKAAIGGFLGLKSPEIVEIMGYAGLDFVIIDSEHGSAGSETLEQMIRAAEVAGITPIVRVTNVFDWTLILRALDSGAQGVQVPMVEDGDTAERVARAARYYPLGRRGLAGVRAAKYGSIDMARYVQEANEQVMVVAQIETVKGVENAAQIAAVDGIDLVFVGPMDLSQSLGIPAQRSNPLLHETMEKVFAACRAADKPCGTLTASVDEGRRQAAAGLQYLCISPAPIFSHCKSLVQGIRS